jgi:hypothetical protein
MAKVRNDTGSVLNSAEFGVIPLGEFEAEGYDPDVHGVIPGCTRLDEPRPPAGKRARGDGDQGKEAGE